MKPITTIFVAAVISIVVAYGTVKFIAPLGDGNIREQESVYDRVMRTGTLNCGYMILPPFFNRDPKTGHFSGVIFDVYETLAKNMSLKVNWVQELGINDFGKALKNNIIDVYCAPLGIMKLRARSADWAGPFLYGGIYPYARANEQSFDSDRRRWNDSSVTFAVLQGETSDIMVHALFPKAKVIPFQPLASNEELLATLIKNKADIVLMDQISGEEFMQKNPGMIKKISDEPIGVFGIGAAIKTSEGSFRQMLNWGIFEMNNSGQLEHIFTQNNLSPDIWIRPAKTYVPAEK